jgi:hypothetical protein
VCIELTVGGRGYGLELSPNGVIVSLTSGGVAEAAGVPVPARIVSVNGAAVANKEEVMTVLGLSQPGRPVPFVFETMARPPSAAVAAAKPAKKEPGQLRGRRRGSIFDDSAWAVAAPAGKQAPPDAAAPLAIVYS